MKKTFASALIEFYNNLDLKVTLPGNVKVLNPFINRSVRDISSSFYNKFYSNCRERIMILGINPGRFGAGITGVTFTDPIRMERECGITNNILKKRELSSVFIYEMIDRYGGPSIFFSQFYMSAVCPLGFVKNGKNLNYYDDKELEKVVKPLIIDSIQRQIDFGCSTDRVICLGEGKNFTFLKKLNDECNIFDEIIPLPHPRFIMQYRLKHKEEFIYLYIAKLKGTIDQSEYVSF